MYYNSPSRDKDKRRARRIRIAMNGSPETALVKEANLKFCVVRGT